MIRDAPILRNLAPKLHAVIMIMASTNQIVTTKGKAMNLCVCIALLGQGSSFVNVASPRQTGWTSRRDRSSRSSPLSLSSSNPNNNSDQAVEALQSLVDFHEGSWKGVATSFTVTNDVAAGIVKRKTSPEYTCKVDFGLDVSNRDYTLDECMAWSDEATGDENSKINTVSSSSSSNRKVSLAACHTDVDSVDASYSLDTTFPDFPSADVSGTNALVQFGIEHCICTGEDERARLFLLYGTEEQLIRMVVCEERRVEEVATTDASNTAQLKGKQQLTAKDLLEMQNDVDKLVEKITGKQGDDPIDVASVPSKAKDLEKIAENTMGRLQEVMAGSSNAESNRPLNQHMMSLLELSSGVWLGDSVIRDVPTVLTSPLESKGFGSKPKSKEKSVPFASWSIGVQKSACRWMWDFGDSIQQIIDAGRGMGTQLADPLKQSLAGSVCVNEGLSRRVPKDERMVYVDWEGDQVSVMVKSFMIQVPRVLQFDQTRRVRPFYTEFSAYQSTAPDSQSDNLSVEDDELPELICSKISRVYNFDGKLKQGCTSFFALCRFGTDGGDEVA